MEERVDIALVQRHAPLARLDEHGCKLPDGVRRGIARALVHGSQIEWLCKERGAWHARRHVGPRAIAEHCGGSNIELAAEERAGPTCKPVRVEHAPVAFLLDGHVEACRLHLPNLQIELGRQIVRRVVVAAAPIR